MHRKERVLSAINHVQPDRTPCDFSANRFALAALQQRLQLSGRRALLEYLGVDIVDLRGVVDPEYAGPVPAERWLADSVRENFWGMRTKVMTTATGPEECYLDFILDRCVDCDEIDQHLWPEVDWFDFSGIKARIRPWSDLAVMASGASVFQHPTFLRRIDTIFTDMLLAPDLVNLLFDKFSDFYLRYFDKLFTEAAGLIDIFRIADDFGMQDRLLISIDLFRQYFAPRIKKLIDMAHSHNIKVMFHSCGAIGPLIPELIALGVDILDPIQPLANEMSPEKIKRQFGDQICLHGAVDTQFLLPKGNAQSIYIEVRNLIDTMGTDGGFILAPSHVLQTDVPVDNIIALYRAAHWSGPSSDITGGK